MRKMRDLNQISFEEFSSIMLWLNTLEKESPEKFRSFLFNICEKCRLAGEMIDVLYKLENKFTDEHLSLAMEHHKVIMVIWILLNGPDGSKDTIH